MLIHSKFNKKIKRQGRVKKKMNVGKVRRAEAHIHIHDSKSHLFAKFDLGFLKAIAKKESVP